MYAVPCKSANLLLSLTLTESLFSFDGTSIIWDFRESQGSPKRTLTQEKDAKHWVTTNTWGRDGSKFYTGDKSGRFV